MSVGQITQKKPDPCSFVIFGVTGDLAHRLVIPALYNLAASDLLPDKFCLVGVARKGVTSDKLRDSLMKGLREFATRPVDDTIAQRLLSCVTCIEADPKDPASFDAMSKQLTELEAARNTGGNRLFYLATPPNAFLPISRELGRTGMLAENGAWRRLVVEKPFGTDLASAKALNSELLKLVPEHEIYRIDHYLGKETVQNILVLRFANGMFEPIWNRNHIDHVQITVDEQLGVGHRGSFYDQTGALRDMVQNHLLQLLCLTAMEPPARNDQESIRGEKIKVLRSLRRIETLEDVARKTVRAQYRAGSIDGRSVPGYLEEDDIAPHSNTETFVALKAEIDNWRWAGVPFYLRTGKRMGHRVSEIVIQFRRVPHLLFPDQAGMMQENRLIIRLQPDESIKLGLMIKVPGSKMVLKRVFLNLNLADTYEGRPPLAYERLLMDVIRGNATLFMHRDEVEEAWKWCEPILDGWQERGDRVRAYSAGSWGPSESIALLVRDDRSWYEQVA